MCMCITGVYRLQSFFLRFPIAAASLYVDDYRLLPSRRIKSENACRIAHSIPTADRRTGDIFGELSEIIDKADGRSGTPGSA